MDDALGVLKVGIDMGEAPREAFRKAIASVLWRIEESRKAKGPLRSHDERVALANRLMRECIDPATRPIGEGALLFMTATGKPGLLTYIANCDRSDCRKMLREILTKWDAEAAERGGR